MTYSAELSRSNPTCFIFLIDQSSSMAEPFGAQQEKRKGWGDGINRLVRVAPRRSPKLAGQASRQRLIH